MPRVEIDLEARNEAWRALNRVHQCATCRNDALVLTLYFSARILENSATAIENRRLADEIRRSRERAANLLAAIRAALAAERDGDADPLWFLRDEYAAPHNTANQHERRWNL